MKDLLLRVVLAAVLGAGVTGCGDGEGDADAGATSLKIVGLPATDVSEHGFPERIAGSGPDDFWAAFLTPMKNGDVVFFPNIWHYDGTSWMKLPLPDTRLDSRVGSTAPALASAGQGAVWAIFSGNQYPTIQVYRITADGNAEDHSADLGPDAPANSTLAVHIDLQGGVYLAITPPSPNPVVQHVYRVVDGTFQHLIDLPANRTAIAFLSDTEIWVQDPLDYVIGSGVQATTYQRLVTGTWEPLESPAAITTHLDSVNVLGGPAATGVFIAGAPIGGALDAWGAGPHGLGRSPEAAGSFATGAPETMGSIIHFDGSSFSTHQFDVLPVASGIARWGMISAAPGVVAILRNHTHGGTTDVESERWDGVSLGAPRVLVHNICAGLPSMGSIGAACTTSLLPVVARLLDGTIVHARPRGRGYELLLGDVSDY